VTVDATTTREGAEMSDQKNTEGDREKENEEAKEQIIDKPSQAEGDEGDSDQG
jgi:hypothetical protein